MPLYSGYRFPTPSRTTLSNGLKILFVERSSCVFTEFHLVVEGGFSADPPERQGLCAMTTAAMTRSPVHGSREPVDTFVQRLGGSFRSRLRADAAVLEMSAFAAGVETSLQAFADAVINPDLDAETLKGVKLIHKATLSKERSNPLDIALRVAPSLVFDAGDPYARPFTGSGNKSGLDQISLSDIHSFHRDYFRPNRATLIVVGPDTGRIASQIEQNFGPWRAYPTAESRFESTPLRANPPGRLVIVDAPGTTQSALFAAFATVPRSSAAAEALMMVDAIIARMFTSRLNMNLREARGWTYGVRSLVRDGRRSGLWLLYSFIQSDKTSDAMSEIECELRALMERNPPSQEEISRAAATLTRGMPSAYETSAQIAAALAEAIASELPDDYFRGLPDRISNLNRDDLVAIAHDICRPPVTWLIIGDVSSIENSLKARSRSKPEFISHKEVP